jgi:predicted PurR-regulated permease PerM
MRGQFLLILLEASFYTTIFYFIGIKYFYIFGIISGVAVLVPYLGIATAYTLTLSAAIAGGMNVTTAIVLITIIYAVVNFAENFFLAPKLVGDRVGLSDLETLIALVAGGTIGGVVGVVLAIPVAAILKVFAIMLYEWYKESSFYLQTFPVDDQTEDLDQKIK